MNSPWLALSLLASLSTVATPGHHPVHYYVNCAAPGPGTGSSARPWTSLTPVNQHTFGPGDTIALRRATTCAGSLHPAGSGTERAPITVTGYGPGPAPVIDGGSAPATVQLSNQDGWTLSGLEIKRGTVYGVRITATDGGHGYFRLDHLIVHDVGLTATTAPPSKASGLIVVDPQNDISHLDHVTVDGARAWHTHMWAGILLGFGDLPWRKSNHMTVRDSVVHDTYGDGIIFFSDRDVLAEHNTVYRSGVSGVLLNGWTPNALWSWDCDSCVVQYNEAYDNHSPDKDGGAYDIDFYSTDSVIQYNYAHDNQGYCFAIFGAENVQTRDSTVRYNICAHNNQHGGNGWHYGEMEIETWNGGGITGARVYSNTFYVANTLFSGYDDSLALGTGIAPGTAVFADNLVYATSGDLRAGQPTLPTDLPRFRKTHNLYFSPAGPVLDAPAGTADLLNRDPRIRLDARYRLRPGSPAIDAGVNLGAMGRHDFFGDPVPSGRTFDIGADEYARWPHRP